MKTSDHKSTTTARQQNKSASSPFFSKEGQGDFFSETKTADPPFFQPKLTIGQPNDKYEQEADAVADAVVNRKSDDQPVIQAKSISSIQRYMTNAEFDERGTNTARIEEDKRIQEKPIQQKAIHESPTPTLAPPIQRTCATCENEGQLQKMETEEDMINEEPEPLQRKPIFESKEDATTTDDASIQRKCATCEQEGAIQPKSIGGETTASPSLQSRLNATKGGGNSLPEETRASMESSIGADFSGVRIHTDSSAVQMSQELGAQAFTHGSDVYFNQGKYDTGSEGGEGLLAHELVHVVQQGGGINRRINKKEEYSKDTSEDRDGNKVLHYKYKGENDDESIDTPYAYRPDIINAFIKDAYNGNDMDNYVGKLIKDEFYVLPMLARIKAILSVSEGYYVDDYEEEFINNLIEYVLDHEKKDIAKYFKPPSKLYTEVSTELDDQNQKRRFNKLMNDYGWTNEKAKVKVLEELENGDFDLDDSASLLGVKDFQSIKPIDKANIIKRIVVDDWYVAEEDGKTILRIIESFHTKEEIESFFKYLHSSGDNTFYDKIIKRITEEQRQKYFNLLGGFWPNEPDIKKYDTLENLINIQDYGSDNFVTTFVENDFKNLEAKDKLNGKPLGTFRLSIINDLLIGFTGNDDENSLIELLTHFPTSIEKEAVPGNESRANEMTTIEGGIIPSAKDFINKALIEGDLKLLREIHDNTHGPEYIKLRKALSTLLDGNEEFKKILTKAINGSYWNNLETIAYYTPESILTSLKIELKIKLVTRIEAGLWTDGWDEETLIRLFKTVEKETPENKKTFIASLDIKDVEDDFQGDNLTEAIQHLNRIDEKGSEKRIAKAINAIEEGGIKNWFYLDDIIGELTDKDLQNGNLISLDNRKDFILGILGSFSRVGDFDEKSLSRIIRNTPPKDVNGLIRWLGEKKGEVYKLLESAIDGLEYGELHAALHEVSMLDFYMADLTGFEGGTKEKSYLTPLDKGKKKKMPDSTYKELLTRKNQVHAMKSLGLKHPRVVPYANTGILSQAIGKTNVDYEVAWSADGKISVSYEIGGLNQQKEFNSAEMIGVYFIYDDDEINAKAGEVRIMPAFNLFELKNNQSNRKIWETLDIVFLFLGVAEFRAAASIIGKILAVIDISLTSSSIIASNFKNDLPEDVLDAVDYANMIFAGYNLLKGGKDAFNKARQAIKRLRQSSSELVGEQRQIIDAIIEGHENQLSLAEHLRNSSESEFSEIRNQISINTDISDGQKIILTKIIDNLDEGKPSYFINGNSIGEKELLETLSDPQFSNRLRNENISITINNASDEVKKAFENISNANSKQQYNQTKLLVPNNNYDIHSIIGIHYTQAKVPQGYILSRSKLGKPYIRIENSTKYRNHPKLTIDKSGRIQYAIGKESKLKIPLNQEQRTAILEALNSGHIKRMSSLGYTKDQIKNILENFVRYTDQSANDVINMFAMLNDYMDLIPLNHFLKDLSSGYKNFFVGAEFMLIDITNRGPDFLRNIDSIEFDLYNKRRVDIVAYGIFFEYKNWSGFYGEKIEGFAIQIMKDRNIMKNPYTNKNHLDSSDPLKFNRYVFNKKINVSAVEIEKQMAKIISDKTGLDKGRLESELKGKFELR